MGRQFLLAARPGAGRLLMFDDEPAARFELAVRSLIDGLYARLAPKK